MLDESNRSALAQSIRELRSLLHEPDRWELARAVGEETERRQRKALARRVTQPPATLLSGAALMASLRRVDSSSRYAHGLAGFYWLVERLRNSSW